MAEMTYNGAKYRELLMLKIQALSRDLELLAPDLVGESDLMTNFEIHLKFPPDGLPTITLVREHIGNQATRIHYTKEIANE